MRRFGVKLLLLMRFFLYVGLLLSVFALLLSLSVVGLVLVLNNFLTLFTGSLSKTLRIFCLRAFRFKIRLLFNLGNFIVTFRMRFFRNNLLLFMRFLFNVRFKFSSFLCLFVDKENPSSKEFLFFENSSCFVRLVNEF